MMRTHIIIASISLALLSNSTGLKAQPVRAPHTPGYVTATELSTFIRQSLRLGIYYRAGIFIMEDIQESQRVKTKVIKSGR